MTTSIVECPHCHYKFNYEFIPAASLGAIRLGTQRIFKCPKCKELHKFDVVHFGKDPSLPTHGDNAETSMGGKILVLMIAPLIILTAVGIVWLDTGMPQGLLILVILQVVGFLWIVVYLVHIYRKANRITNKE
jgi:NAD-dependent SIR2 family protein deacetylase